MARVRGRPSWGLIDLQSEIQIFFFVVPNNLKKKFTPFKSILIRRHTEVNKTWNAVRRLKSWLALIENVFKVFCFPFQNFISSAEIITQKQLKLNYTSCSCEEEILKGKLHGKYFAILYNPKVPYLNLYFQLNYIVAWIFVTRSYYIVINVGGSWGWSVNFFT